MLILKLAAWLSTILGLLFLFAPKTLLNLNKAVSSLLNKILLDVDAALYRSRLGIGISLCLSGATLFFILYYMTVKYGMR
jgi:hypothetical protein